MPFIALTNNQTSLSPKQLMVICFGNAVAYFDFLIYLFMADIISATFFPTHENPVLAKLQAFSLFSAGYLTRPIGALLIGRYADVSGRKPALLMSLLCIAITTLITASLPTYAQVGMLAPILFFVARLFQGMAFGAHTPLGWVYIAEHVPKSNLATYLSFVTASFMFGQLGANLLFEALTTTYTQEQLIDSGWRIPFVWGAMLSFVAVMLWNVLDETPIFSCQQVAKKYVPKLAEIGFNFRRFNAIFLALVLTFIISSLSMVIALLLPELILMRFSVDESMLSFSNNLGLLFLMIGCVFFGLIADKSSTGKALMMGSFALIIQALAFYYHLENSAGSFILLMYAILGFCAGIMSLGSVILVQLFPTEVRVIAVGLTYNCTYAVIGTALPFGLAYATNMISFSPALYLTFVGLVSFIIGLYIFRLPKFRDLDASLKL
ncbi:MFS transporter [Psychrobacter sp. FDAARGOS_221]|uniref:MFS transporter n=1 Tax=Psychrobacter sp. FDAARGOS_221 TaxID=1975705 RepID=UPI000BB55C8A|nr:MFS transporter [Psychrobacter sp. FDAARGOS_221]PNK60074.1 MFS transporter [Psychrobacter sp. FDAARGOS_221]